MKNVERIVFRTLVIGVIYLLIKCNFEIKWTKNGADIPIQARIAMRWKRAFYMIYNAVAFYLTVLNNIFRFT